MEGIGLYGLMDYVDDSRSRSLWGAKVLDEKSKYSSWNFHSPFTFNQVCHKLKGNSCCRHRGLILPQTSKTILLIKMNV
jgi:hypothetical protein